MDPPTQHLSVQHLLSIRSMAKTRDYLSMCPQERSSIYKFNCQAYPLLKRIGPLAAPQCYFLCLLSSYRCLYRKPLKSYLSVFAVIPCPPSPISTLRSSLGSTLLLIENATIDPSTLRVIRGDLSPVRLVFHSLDWLGSY